MIITVAKHKKLLSRAPLYAPVLPMLSLTISPSLWTCRFELVVVVACVSQIITMLPKLCILRRPRSQYVTPQKKSLVFRFTFVLVSVFSPRFTCKLAGTTASFLCNLNCKWSDFQLLGVYRKHSIDAFGLLRDMYKFVSVVPLSLA